MYYCNIKCKTWDDLRNFVVHKHPDQDTLLNSSLAVYLLQRW